MNMRSLVLSAAIVGQVLAACNAAPATIAPAQPPTLAPAVPPPTPVPTAAQIANERSGGEGGFEPGSCTAAIAGIQAVVLTQVADQGPTCEMLFVRGDRLYTLKFALPDPDDTPEVGDALVHLFNTVTASFTLPTV